MAQKREKKNTDDMFVKVYKQKSDGSIESKPKHVPKHLLNNPKRPDFARRNGLILADVVENNPNNPKMIEGMKEQFKEYLSSMRDRKMVEGMLSFEPLEWKKLMINARLVELETESKTATP